MVFVGIFEFLKPYLFQLIAVLYPTKESGEPKEFDKSKIGTCEQSNTCTSENKSPEEENIKKI